MNKIIGYIVVSSYNVPVRWDECRRRFFTLGTPSLYAASHRPIAKRHIRLHQFGGFMPDDLRIVPLKDWRKQ